MSKVYINSIHFENYKAFSDFRIYLDDITILVGPNNSGKSTILSSLRLLDLGLKKANAKIPTRIDLDGFENYYGHFIDNSLVGVSLENVSTDYNGRESIITFNLSNKNKMFLVFPDKETCVFTWQSDNSLVLSPKEFRKEFPLKILVVPVLGPLEDNETILTDETIRKGLNTHRASRHFRNYWWKNNEGWDDFQKLVERTWPGMEIKKPELIDQKLRMFCSENRYDRELFWSGFGFQIWCQLLTHLSRAADSSIVVIDEPEVYLHPEVQRQLMGILREIQSPVIIATHSVEILGDSEPSEIVVIDKARNSGLRLKDVKGVQRAISFIGSTHNILLAQLARTRKMLFVENLDDFKVSLKLAGRAGFEGLFFSNQITPFESRGFSGWEEIKIFAKGIDRTIEEQLLIAIVLDRDYFPDEQISYIENELEANGVKVYIHRVKEIENYLINYSVIQRAVNRNIRSNSYPDMKLVINSICEKYKTESLSNYIAKRIDYFGKTKKDSKTINTEAITWFEKNWMDEELRLKIIPGKSVLSGIRQYLQDEYKLTLTSNRIIDSFTRPSASLSA